MSIIEWIRDLVYGKFINQINLLKSQKEELRDIIKNLESTIDVLRTKTVDLENEIIRLNEPQPPKPKWLDIEKQAYQPRIQVVQNGIISNITITPQDIYNVSPTLIKLVKDHNWEKMNLNKKLKQIWYWICLNYTYEFDTVEAWQYPTTTFFRKKGDCEDTTILFVTLCRLAGVPADKIFNACGWYYKDKEKYGHSYPIAQMEDGIWYIFESTLNFASEHPKQFKGSNYEANWGLSNWLYAGCIKEGVQI